MAEIKPFYCVRPAAESASRVAALPYDVYNSCLLYTSDAADEL